ncbi:PAS domain S-box-containing protein [Natranaerovirga hydrolytica]|uniref:PAS domain S-box-containing protein n=1 Tax=Natranaerovirga hydrolytica TaxID=680378 RepID=A0A4R1N3J8_9FIRM|nr:helix-turn-helix domain-containing protein [Natranaerovirga hydrolytica]TCL00072.1 PAS domain S-box-containing protein [Natranaerovirga hydrolytica]
MTKLDNYLKKARENIMTQRELAKRIGVGYPYISKLENNKEHNPSDNVLYKISKALNLDIDELFIQANKITPDLYEFLLNEPDLIQILRVLMDNKSLLKELKKHIQEREDYLSCVFNHTNKIILITNKSTGKIVQANEVAQKFYGYSNNEWSTLSVKNIDCLTDSIVKENIKRPNSKTRNGYITKHKLKKGDIVKVRIYSKTIVCNNKTYIMNTIYPFNCHKINEKEDIKENKT